MKLILMCAIFLAFTGMKTDAEKDIHKLINYMSGSFSSEKQSQSDSSFFDIRLEMKPIWKKRNRGYWLYVEQARADLLSKPYRQRIYQITHGQGDTIISQVYELPNPQRFIGAFKSGSGIWKSMTSDSLISREGCAIYLLWNKEKKQFTGSTWQKKCISNLRGAAYATSEVVITSKRLLSWDRGWNSQGVQVWGAVKGGYEFVKIKK